MHAQDVAAGKAAAKNTMSWVFTEMFSRVGGLLQWQVSAPILGLLPLTRTPFWPHPGRATSGCAAKYNQMKGH